VHDYTYKKSKTNAKYQSLFSEAKQSSKPATTASKVNHRTSPHLQNWEEIKVPILVNMKSREGKQQYSAENDPRERYIRCIGVEVQYILSKLRHHTVQVYL